VKDNSPVLEAFAEELCGAGADREDLVLKNAGIGTSALGVHSEYLPVQKDANPKTGETVFEGAIGVTVDFTRVLAVTDRVTR